MRRSHCAVAWVLACAACSCAWAQPTAYPNRPLRFIVPYAAGGNGDIVSRIIGPRLAAQLGQQVVIDNRAGAGGNIGAELAARAAPDGYTIMLGTNTHAINMSLYAKLGYDLQKDFAPITLATSAPMVLIVHPSLPAKTVKEFIALAKAHPNKLNYGTGGSGSSAHVITELFESMAGVHPSLPAKTVKEFIALAKAHPNKLNYGTGGSGSSAHVITELFKSMAGVQLVHVAYKGVAQSTTDLIAGQIQMTFSSPASALTHMQAGRVRALAISSAARSAAAPGLPTLAESGLAGFDASIWQGIFAPARTAPDIIARLNREITGVLGTREIKEQLAAQGVDAQSSTPEGLAAYVVVEIAKWAKVIKVSGAKVD